MMPQPPALDGRRSPDAGRHGRAGSVARRPPQRFRWGRRGSPSVSAMACRA